MADICIVCDHPLCFPRISPILSFRFFFWAARLSAFLISSDEKTVEESHYIYSWAVSSHTYMHIFVFDMRIQFVGQSCARCHLWCHKTMTAVTRGAKPSRRKSQHTKHPCWLVIVVLYLSTTTTLLQYFYCFYKKSESSCQSVHCSDLIKFRWFGNPKLQDWDNPQESGSGGLSPYLSFRKRCV